LKLESRESATKYIPEIGEAFQYWAEFMNDIVGAELEKTVFMRVPTENVTGLFAEKYKDIAMAAVILTSPHHWELGKLSWFNLSGDHIKFYPFTGILST
jgi:hypothetical protein